MAKTSPNKQIVIFSGFSSSLEAIKSRKMNCGVVRDIISTAATMIRSPYHITFVRIPAPVGIPANELADSLTKSAAPKGQNIVEVPLCKNETKDLAMQFCKN